MNETKPVTIGFMVPATLDTPSETLARMKQILIEALSERIRVHWQGGRRMSPEDLALCHALLTES